MNNITYDVRLYKTEIYKGKRVTTYTARWKVGVKVWREPFRNVTQADSFTSELRVAARKGEAFDLTTGRPVSWGRADKDVSWYAFCLAYTDMKWKGISGKHRANTASALLTVTPVMISSDRGRPGAKEIRTALRRWAFNAKNRADCPPDAAEVLRWMEHNTKPMSALTDPSTVRDLLDAAATCTDGTPAAASSVQRNRAILHHACEYAVETGVLASNPIKTTKWKARRGTVEIDRSSVVNHRQARRLLDAVRAQEPSGQRLVAFFAVVYYAALRPEEAVNLRIENVTLPDLVWDDEAEKWEEPGDNWGELRFSLASPEVGPQWTDDGATREYRRLKGRAEGEWRRVPVPPPLTRILRVHLRDIKPGPAGRVFSGVQGGELAAITYRRAWTKAREAVFTPVEVASPLGRRVYDLRHACVSTWLNGGVPAPQVAEWAGHSVEVLLRVYAKCIDGQDAATRKRIERALEEGDC